ncbi:Uncharacterised protein [Vibrio cholerae]|nr:Uncharacterised protein [Vibrio cholerae]
MAGKTYCSVSVAAARNPLYTVYNTTASATRRTQVWHQKPTPSKSAKWYCLPMASRQDSQALNYECGVSGLRA